MTIPTETAERFAHLLLANGLTAEDLYLLLSGAHPTREAATALKIVCDRLRARMSGNAEHFSDYSYLQRASRALAGRQSCEYETRILAAMIELRETEPKSRLNGSTIANTMQVSRQTVSRALKQHNIRLNELLPLLTNA